MNSADQESSADLPSPPLVDRAPEPWGDSHPAAQPPTLPHPMAERRSAAIQVAWEPAADVPRELLWVATLCVAWAVIVVSISWLGQWTGNDLIVCQLRRFTGWPCPTCGGTRMALALLTGHVSAAFFYNPGLFLLVTAGGLWFFCRTVLRYRLRITTTGLGKRLLWLGASAAFVMNWLYLVWTDFGAFWR